MYLSWQGGEEIPQRPEMMRKQEAREISKYAGADICLKSRLQRTTTAGHERQTHNTERGTLSLCEVEKYPCSAEGEEIKGSHAYLTLG